MGVSFETYKRRRRDELMGRRGCVPLRRLGGATMRRSWMFHLRLVWDVVKTYRWESLLRPLETSPRRSSKMSWTRITETSWRRSIEKSLSVSFETYLRRRWDLQRDVVTMSPRCLVAGWESIWCLLYKQWLCNANIIKFMKVTSNSTQRKKTRKTKN